MTTVINPSVGADAPCAKLSPEHVVQFQQYKSDQDGLLQVDDEGDASFLDERSPSAAVLVRGSTENAGTALIDFTPCSPSASLWPALAPCPASSYQYSTKRLLDVVLAVIILTVISPLLLVLALFVVFSSGRPVFYSHERVGRYGRHFQCHKLRTMVTDADARLRPLLLEDPDARAEFAATQKLEHDPRVTAFGQFLRRTSLDELPQLFNVLKGEMSLVGPRPVTSNELDRYGGAAEEYSAVRPGITGLWQVSGRSRLGYEDRIHLDLHYIRNISLLLDLRLLIRTALVVLKRSGAY